MQENPFTIYTYRSPEYFCDRNKELSDLLGMFDNRRFALLHSMRRLGKTGLIHHFHHSLKKRKDVVCVFCDVLNTSSDKDFMEKFITSVVQAIEKSQDGFNRRVGRFFASLRPIVTIDPVMNTPAVQLNIESPKDVEVSIQSLISMLASFQQTVQIAIDEFQQIATYEEGTLIDATLRGYIQEIPNVHFIFSGSQRHLLTGLFTGPKKPLFGSVEPYPLKKLDRQVYGEFIARHFEAGEQVITDEAVDEILDWTRIHTFYTQFFCNKLYSQRHEQVGLYEVEMVKREILYAFEPGFLSLQSVVSQNQLKVLKGIAQAGSVESVGSTEFLSRNVLAHSSASQALKVLVQEELVHEELSKEGSRYFVYDPFFSRWLENW